MKLSFSTIGCPDWSLEDILIAGSDLGYDGIEFRGIGKEVYTPACPDFSDSKISKTLDRLKEHHLQICCLTSGACFYNENCQKEIMDYITLANKLGVKYIRVLGDSQPHPSDLANDKITHSILEEMAPIATAKGITLCVETNGIYADTKRLAGILKKYDGAVGALWDINHPIRFFQETPEQTYDNIGPYLKHVHIKDSISLEGTIQYKLVGRGDLPIADVVKLLQTNGYDGFLSLEWIKRWNAQLEEPAMAFLYYVHEMKRLKA